MSVAALGEEMAIYTDVEDLRRVEHEMPYEARGLSKTLYSRLTRTRDMVPQNAALSFQLLSGPRDHAVTFTWSELHERVTETANLFRHLGVGPHDTVAMLLPNCPEAAITLLAGATAGIVCPINPLLGADLIADILRHTEAKVLVTLRSFPKVDIAQKAAQAVAEAPNVEAVVEVDLNRYLTGIKKFVVPMIRPKTQVKHNARILNFEAEASSQNHNRLDFEDRQEDRVAAYFHTGGTTGRPKVAQHRFSGMLYNGWLGETLLFTPDHVLMCPLPLFHVFAAYPIFLSCVSSGAHLVMPTPAGYRGDGVMDNFWKLIERWQATFVVTVPTAISALMQRPVDADVSSLETAISGSAPLPVELYNRFRAATGVEIAEGYGLTEATCLISCNPPYGRKKVGSVGVALPYTHVRILRHGPDGSTECATDEVGEICVAGPGVNPGSVYTEIDKNRDLFTEGRYLRTGDLGRIDADGYIWITGRAKDLIIRGGHNIDPAEIEEALLSHPAVAFAGAIGQPDAFAGELPCVYVELVQGASVTEDALLAYARDHIAERAAVPKHLEIVAELPKTAIGKIFKPALRKLAIARVIGAELQGIGASVVDVVDDKRRGLTMQIRRGNAGDEALREVLGRYSLPWDLVD